MTLQLVQRIGHNKHPTSCRISSWVSNVFRYYTSRPTSTHFAYLHFAKPIGHSQHLASDPNPPTRFPSAILRYCGCVVGLLHAYLENPQPLRPCALKAHILCLCTFKKKFLAIHVVLRCLYCCVHDGRFTTNPVLQPTKTVRYKG